MLPTDGREAAQDRGRHHVVRRNRDLWLRWPTKKLHQKFAFNVPPTPDGQGRRVGGRCLLAACADNVKCKRCRHQGTEADSRAQPSRQRQSRKWDSICLLRLVEPVWGFHGRCLFILCATTKSWEGDGDLLLLESARTTKWAGNATLRKAVTVREPNNSQSRPDGQGPQCCLGILAGLVHGCLISAFSFASAAVISSHEGARHRRAFSTRLSRSTSTAENVLPSERKRGSLKKQAERP